MFDSEVSFFKGIIEVCGRVHRRLGIIDHRTVIEVIGLAEGLLGQLFVLKLLGEVVPLVVKGVLMAFLLDLFDLKLLSGSPGSKGVAAGLIFK
jgi:hypothetical protein